jgi:hypothetical protein
MHPTISYELAKARNADLRSQAQRGALARAAAHLSSSGPPPGRNQIPASLRRMGRPRRLGTRLWALLHAQVWITPSLVETRFSPDALVWVGHCLPRYRRLTEPRV